MPTATQVESFCESCGTRYAFEPRRARGRHLVRVGRMVGILADDEEIDSSALVVSRDPFHGAFHFCLECRRFTCPSCWDTSAGFCRTCAATTGASDLDAADEDMPDPETEAILQAAVASLLRLGSDDAWLRLEPPPAPRAEIWVAPPEMVETPEDDLAPMIEAGLAALGAKALAGAERAAAEAEQRRLSDELRQHEERLVAEQAEQARLAHESEQARLLDAQRLAWEAEQARLAWEAEQARLAQEADMARHGPEVRQAPEAQQLDRVPPAHESPQQVPDASLDTSDASSRPADGAYAATVGPDTVPEAVAPTAWTVLAASLGPDVEAGQAVAAPEPVGPSESVVPPASPVPPTTPPPVAPPVIAETAPPPEVVFAESLVPPPAVLETPAAVSQAPAAPEQPLGQAAPIGPLQPSTPLMVPQPPPVMWQMTAPVAEPPQWAPPPPGQVPARVAAAPPSGRRSRSGFLAAPVPGPIKGGVRPCPRCDLPLSGQARFCRRCGLPQA